VGARYITSTPTHMHTQTHTHTHTHTRTLTHAQVHIRQELLHSFRGFDPRVELNWMPAHTSVPATPSLVRVDIDIDRHGHHSRTWVACLHSLVFPPIAIFTSPVTHEHAHSNQHNSNYKKVGVNIESRSRAHS
jgi:hypothetical protein